MVAYTAGFTTHVTCRLTAKNRDQLRNTKLDNRVWATFTFLCLGGQCPQRGGKCRFLLHVDPASSRHKSCAIAGCIRGAAARFAREIVKRWE